MKAKTKIISLFLAFLISAPMIVSCSDNSGNSNGTDTTNSTATGDTAASTEAESDSATSYSADIPADVKYDGYDFRILTNQPDGTIWGDVDWNATEMTGEIINDAVYERSRRVEELLGITITPVPSTDGTAAVRSSVLSNEDAYDMTYLTVQNAFNLAADKQLTALSAIPTLQLDQPWWDQNSVHDLSIGRNVYIATGDIGSMYKKSIGVIMFNKEILSNYGLQSPYDLLSSNEWTIDNMVTMAQQVSQDLNGDGAFTGDDQYGLIYFCDMMGLAFIGCGVQFVTKNEEDIPELTFYDEKTVSIMEKLATLLYNPELAWSWSKNGTGEEPAFAMFQNNQSLFYYGELHAVATMRSMDADFGILPMPLYDTTQKSYHHCVNPYAAMSVTVPLTVTDLERTGYVLDALGAESKNLLTPAYYNVTLKGKVSRDEESAASLDVVLSTVRYDLGYIANWGMTSIPLSMADSYDTDLASKWAKAERSVQVFMNRAVKAFTGE